MSTDPLRHPDGSTSGRGQHPEGLRVVRADDPSEVEETPVDLDVNKAEQGACTEVARRPGSVLPEIPEAIDDPHRLARQVLSRYSGRGGETLVYYRGDYYTHDGASYRRARNFEKGDLVQAVKLAVNRGFAAAHAAGESRKASQGSSGESGRSSSPRTVPRVTRTLTGDVDQALASMVAIDDEAEAPFWLDARPGDADPSYIVAVENGLLDLGGERPVLNPHSPRFFSTARLPYSYDPHAPRPEGWLRFLADLWADDPESIECLHEVMGYLLTMDNRYQKMFLLIGPRRSGKSTISNVITALIGQQNVASCSPNSLGSKFGLQPLLGKSLAIMADARTGNASPVLIDRLVRITGGDPVEVNRKNKPILDNVRLTTRFVIVSNELPEVRDASKAITSRYIILRTTKSVPSEQQDVDLSRLLAAELPGILNLAIEGRARLMARGRFRQPSSGADLLADAEDLASPVAQFVRECLILDPHGTVPRAEAFQAWKRWADRNGYEPGNSATFGKNLKAAFAGLKSKRPRVDGSQKGNYVGLRLRQG